MAHIDQSKIRNFCIIVIVTNVTSLPTRAIKEPPSFVNLDRCPSREALSKSAEKPAD